MITKIGVCAHYSKQGDWAFEFAREVAQRKSLRMNVFHWLDSPYRYHRELVYKNTDRDQLVTVTPELVDQKERELREYYDGVLGDFVEVGFRLCEGIEDMELMKCLRKDQFDVLVIGYREKGILFGRESIEAFAKRFQSPIILVGPDRKDQVFLNERAEQIADQLEMPAKSWAPLASINKTQEEGLRA